MAGLTPDDVVRLADEHRGQHLCATNETGTVLWTSEEPCVVRQLAEHASDAWTDGYDTGHDGYSRTNPYELEEPAPRRALVEP